MRTTPCVGCAREVRVSTYAAHRRTAQCRTLTAAWDLYRAGYRAHRTSAARLLPREMCATVDWWLLWLLAEELRRCGVEVERTIPSQGSEVVYWLPEWAVALAAATRAACRGGDGVVALLRKVAAGVAAVAAHGDPAGSVAVASLGGLAALTEFGERARVGA